MLPRISQHSSVPHISLSVALFNLTSYNTTTNKYHPATHECARNSAGTVAHLSYNLVNSYIKLIKNKELEYPIHEVRNDLLAQLEGTITNLKNGVYEHLIKELSINQKAEVVQDIINDVLYHTAMSYVK
jgi:hypothetical protein